MTREQIEQEISEFGSTIFVRAKVNGKWDSVAISQVDEETKEYYINLWLSRGMQPVRIADARENLL